MILKKECLFLSLFMQVNVSSTLPRHFKYHGKETQAVDHGDVVLFLENYNNKKNSFSSNPNLESKNYRYLIQRNTIENVRSSFSVHDYTS